MKEALYSKASDHKLRLLYYVILRQNLSISCNLHGICPGCQGIPRFAQNGTEKLYKWAELSPKQVSIETFVTSVLSVVPVVKNSDKGGKL